MTLPIHQLLYASDHDNPVTDNGYSTAIYQIGLESTARNEELGVTGFLICTPRWFAQLLEGRQEAVESVMEKIARDPRHHSLRTLLTRRSAVRLFPNWSMGIATLDSGNRSLFLQNGLSVQDAPSFESADNLLHLARELSRVRA